MEQWKYTAVAWTTLGLIVASVYYFTARPSKQSVKPLEPLKALKQSSSNQPANSAGDPRVGKQSKAAKKKPKPATANSSGPLTSSGSNKVNRQAENGTSTVGDIPEESDDGDNVEWARRAAIARSGVSLKTTGPSAKAGSSTRTVKQSAVNAAIPEVADMLEPPAAAPSSIRVVGNGEMQSKPAKKVASQSPAPAETKKQRQNRRKAEQRRAENDEAIGEQKVLMEQQRRRAREARGEPAKDGSAFLAELNHNSYKAAVGKPAEQESSLMGNVTDGFDSTNESTENDDGWLQVGKKSRRRERAEDGTVEDGNRVGLADEAGSKGLNEVATGGVSGCSQYRPPLVSPGIGHPLDSAWTVE